MNGRIWAGCDGMKRKHMKKGIYLFVVLAGIYAGAGTGQSKVRVWDKELIKAIQDENDSKILALLDGLCNAGVESIAKDTQGISVLHWAVRSRRIKVLNHVIRRIREQDANAVSKYWRYSIEMPVCLERLNPEDKVTGVKWSPDGSRLCTGSDKTVQVWNVQGKCLATFYSSGVRTVQWSPDGSWLCIVNKDGTTKLWGVWGEEEIDFGHDRDKVRAVKWSRDGSKICMILSNRVIRVLSILAKSMFSIKYYDWMGHMTGIRTVRWSPDGSTLSAVSSYGEVRVWNVQGKILVRLGHLCNVKVVAWSPDRSKLCAVGNDGDVKVWDMQGRHLLTLRHKGEVKAVSWSPNGSVLYTMSSDGVIKIWDGEETWQVQLECYGPVDDVVWNQDGSKLYGKSVTIVQVWDIQGKRLMVFGHNDEVTLVKWSPAGSQLFMGSWDGTVRIWEAREGQLVEFDHTCWVKAVSWSPDGSKLCTVDKEGVVRLWDLGGTVVDWAVREVCAGQDVDILMQLLGLDECKNLKGLCSDNLMHSLCYVASKVGEKSAQAEKLEKVIKMISQKGEWVDSFR